jgi:group I intron endonuclease
MSGNFYIYLWRNLTNGKAYVGKGSGSRATHHARPAARTTLAKAIQKHGIGCFECRILCTDMSESLAFDIEKQMIQTLNTKSPNGYNLTDGGEGTSGNVLSEESRALMRHRAVGRKPKPKSRESIERGAAKIRGIPRSEETKTKMSLANKGRKLSPETRAKLSARRRGKTLSEAHRKSLANKRATPETKAKMSEARKAFWERKRQEKSLTHP